MRAQHAERASATTKCRLLIEVQRAADKKGRALTGFHSGDLVHIPAIDVLVECRCIFICCREREAHVSMVRGNHLSLTRAKVRAYSLSSMLATLPTLHPLMS